MSGKYNDYDNCLKSLVECEANYYTNTTRETDESGNEVCIYKIVCFSPYITYDYKENRPIVNGYVYNWADYFDSNGKFMYHIPFEGKFLVKLDITI